MDSYYREVCIAVKKRSGQGQKHLGVRNIASRGRVEQLLPPDRQIRRLTKLNTTWFAILGLDLAIQAEQTVAAEWGFRRHLTLKLKCSLPRFAVDLGSKNVYNGHV